VRALRSITFVYVPREDRILAAINAGRDDAWSCWLTRRLALAVLERTTDYVASSSNLALRAPADLRGEMATFEREAAIAKTAPAMSVTTGTVLNMTAEAAELAERLTISQQANGFHFELRGLRGDGAAGHERSAVTVLAADETVFARHIVHGGIRWPCPPFRRQGEPLTNCAEALVRTSFRSGSRRRRSRWLPRG